jgi:translocation and assembly module TamB
MTEHPTTAPAPQRARRRRWPRVLVHAISALIAALVVGVVAIAVLMVSPAGVDLLVAEFEARSGGALVVDGATGTLANTVRARSITWRGKAMKVEATDVALSWRPLGLLSRNVVVHGLGARALTIVLESSSSDVALPESLEMPIDVVIERLAVGSFAWRVGADGGRIEGLEFGYAGGTVAHQVTDLKMVMGIGTLTGHATLGAREPFALEGAFELAGDATLRDARVDLVAKGTLASVAIDAGGRVGEGRLSGHATLAPLAVVPLASLFVEATDVDLAQWNRALPTTRLAAKVDARAVDGGLAGTLEASNAIPGKLDADRTPIRALSTRFAWQADRIALDDFSAELVGNAKATGQARIALGDRVSGGRWTLDLRDVDAHEIYAPLVATRLAGSIVADFDAARRAIGGNLVDRRFPGGLAVDFAATFDENSVDVSRLRARAGGGELAGRGRLALDRQRAFAVDATATRLDPSRFGSFPAASLDGKVTATGVLSPAWRADADIAIAKGSVLAGKPLHGTVRGRASPGHLRDAEIDLTLGSATIKARGGFGDPADRMVASLDAPRVADLNPLLPAGIPHPQEGELRVDLQMTGAPPLAGVDLVAKGSGHKFSGAFAIGAFDAHVAIAPAPAGSAQAELTSRSLRIDVDARDVKTPSGDVARAGARVAGTLAAHTVSIALDGGDIGLDAAGHGGMRGNPATDAPSALAWSGTIDSLSGRGPWALRLAAPATLSLAYRNAHLGQAQIKVADGIVDIGDFVWDEGRITSRGRFTGVPVATVARLAGRELPVRSTLTMGGDWSLAAAPRLTGSVSVHREQGDLWLVRESEAGAANLASGITALEARAQLADDALDATATFRSARGGSADATLSIGAVADAPPGRLSPDAPLALTLVADLASMELLQPWAGTTALVNGRLHLALAARGTMRDAPLSGTVRATDLRIDAAQFGLHLRDGRVNARLADRHVTLDEASFSAGDGNFRATGTFAAPTDDPGATAASVKWRAEKFRVLNRPDLNLVVSGDGELALAKGKVSLTGSLRADEGRIVNSFDPGATLGDDVVVKGWQPRASDPMRTLDIPLVLDVKLDFGDRLTFVGRGIDAGLRGEVRVRNGPGGFTGQGQLYTVNGTYFAYGQRLSIDPGRLIFDGPLDNPALDIVALRRNLAVEAGVQVTGTVRVPIITLTSNPPVPDSEKLSWLVLGQGVDRASGTDLAALQAASAALLGPNSRPVTTSIAQSIGLDDISVRSGAAPARNVAGGTPGVTGQVVSIGKRISENLTIAWEQGLTVATNALRVEYALSNSLSLRAEAGTVSGLGVYYRKNFE